MADNIRIEGMNDVLRALDNVGDLQSLYHKMGKACALVEGAAKEKAPKGDTGELRRSISSRVEIEGEEIVGTVFTPLEYGPYVEFGTGLFAEEGGRQDVPWCYQDDKGEWHTTSGQHPHPYMRPALYENVDRIKQILTEGHKDG